MAVNLLPWREACLKKNIQQLGVMFAAGLILILICWSILSVRQVIFLLGQQQEIRHLQRQLQGINGNYQRYLAAAQQRQQRVQTENFINDALRTNQALLQLLRELGEKMPPDMYLTQIQKNKKVFGFSGKSTSHAEITLLLERLENKAQPGQPQLTETRHLDRQNPEIDFDLIYNLQGAL